jgi:hypothetical protein
MLTKKIIVFLLIFSLILPTISVNVLSRSATDDSSSNSNRGLMWRLLRMRFNIGFIDPLMLGRYFYRQLRPPVPIQSYPDAVDLRYLDNITFNIGGKNAKTLEWEPMIKVAGHWSWAWFNPRTIYTFEFVPPEDAPGDVWNVQFDPEKLIMDTNMENLEWPGAEQPFKTNVTIMLKNSLDPTYPTQDVILKVNIVREEVLAHTRIRSGAPAWTRNNLQGYKDKMNAMDPDAYQFWSIPINRITWNLLSKRVFFFTNLQFPPYDKWIDSTVEILVRVDKYHEAIITPPSPQDISPYEVKSIPISILNIGSHIDTFNFRVTTDAKDIVVTPPPAITLKPGEEAQALLGVAAPKSFISIGSTTSLFIEAYSVYDPNTIFPNTVILSTIGIHAEGSATYNFVLLIITLFVIVGIFLYIARRRREKISIKPDKPWDIPEEKKSLEKLKIKDKEKYNDTLKMMKDEYTSAILWYNNYCDALLKKKKSDVIKKKKTPRKKIEVKIDFKKFLKTFDGIKKIKIPVKKIKIRAKKDKTKVKKEKKKKKLIPEIKPVEKPKKIKKEKTKEIKKKEIIIDKKAELEKIKRQRAIERIKRAQDRQLRKIGE